MSLATIPGSTAVSFQHFPIIVTGNTAAVIHIRNLLTIAPYFVTMEPGA